MPHFQLTSPPETMSTEQLDGLKMALSLWTAEKLLGARAGIVVAAPGANRLNAPPIENHHECETKMVHVIER